jgi:hypothetical protein
MGLTLNTPTRSAMAAALLAKFTATSKIEIRGGTRPAVTAASTGTTLLATVTLPNPAFTEALGVLTLSDPAAVTAVATGTATWFRALDAANATILDGKVGATGDATADLTLATTSLSTGLSVDITSGQITMPVGTPG